MANIVLKPLDTRCFFKIGNLSDVDLFNEYGELLITKGSIITEIIGKLHEQNKLYYLELEDINPQNTEINLPLKESLIYMLDVSNSIRNLYNKERLLDASIVHKCLHLLADTLKELNNEQIFIVLDNLRNYDQNTFYHSLNVGVLATIVAVQSGWNHNLISTLSLGAFLHDIGKTSIPLHLLNKPQALTPSEFEVIKRHPDLGVEFLRNAQVNSDVLALVSQHHEWWDGKGYPHGLKCKQIHTLAQILAVVDVFEALISDRPYRKGFPPYHALEIVFNGSGTQFSPEILSIFRKIFTLYPEGSMVKLNTGEIGLVISIPSVYPTRPQVRLLTDADANKLSGETVIDLLTDHFRYISVIFNTSTV